MYFAATPAAENKIEFSFQAGYDYQDLGNGFEIEGWGHGFSNNNACTSPNWPSNSAREVAPGIYISTLITHDFNSQNTYGILTLKLSNGADPGTYIRKIQCVALGINVDIGLTGQIDEVSFAPGDIPAPLDNGGDNLIQVTLR